MKVGCVSTRAEWHNRNAFEGKGFRSYIHYGGRVALVAISLREGFKPLYEIAIESCGRLYFCWNELSAALLDQIDFNAVAIAVEVEVRSLPGVESALHCFEDNQVLEETSAKRIAVELLRVFDTCESTGKSSIVEIDFGRFDEPFAPVFVPWWKEEADVRRVEDGEPFHYSLRGNSGVVGNGCDIEYRADASGNKFEESGKEHGILDIQKQMDVALHVCVDVARKKSSRLSPSRDNAGIPAIEDRGHRALVWKRRRCLFHAEGEKRMNRASSGKRLADTLHKKKVAGTCQDEQPVLAFVVNNSLNVGKQIGYALYFVKHRAVRKSGEKRLGVAFGSFACAWMFKRLVGLVWEKCLYKCCFARLPWTDNRDDGKVLRRFPYCICHVSFDFHARYYNIFYNFMQYGKATSRIA